MSKHGHPHIEWGINRLLCTSPDALCNSGSGFTGKRFQHKCMFDLLKVKAVVFPWARNTFSPQKLSLILYVCSMKSIPFALGNIF